MHLSRIIDKEIFWHVLFWCLYVFIRVAVIQLYPGSLLERIGMELIELPLKMLALYFAIYILIRKLLLARRYVILISVSVVYILVVMILNRLEDFYITYPLIEPVIAKYEPSLQNLNATFLQNSITRHEDGLWNLNAAFLNLIYIYPVVGLGAAAYFAKGWYDNYLKVERMEKEKLSAELRILKDQLHPHFLFNTLNNIYSLSQVQSPRTPEMIHRLSQLLGFMLYDARGTLLPLSKELQAVQDYIELERMRLGERLELTFNASGDLSSKQIAPLILFPFLENCFKHGSHKTVNKVWISFNLSLTGDKLIVQIENSLPEEIQPKCDPGEQSGMGLLNAKKRLELVYPGKHRLTLHPRETYLVKLELLLS